MGGKCDSDPACSHVAVHHVVENRRTSGQNTDRERGCQFGNLMKISVDILNSDMCHAKHQQHQTLLLTGLINI